MKNKTPDSYKPLNKRIDKLEAGVIKHLVDVIMGQNTLAALQGTKAMLAGTAAGPGGVPAAVPGVKDKLERARAAKVAATTAKLEARINSRYLAMLCINSLKTVNGRKWNAKWRPVVGLNTGSLAIDPDPTAVLEGLGNYYEANPLLEATNVNGLNCTAAGCRASLAALKAAESDSDSANALADAAKITFDEAINAARNRIIGTRTELGQLLSDDDSRWIDYGYRKPSDMSAPDMPENLTVNTSTLTALLSEWDDSVRSDSYRLVIKDAAGLVLVDKIVWDNEYMAHHLTSGTTVTVEVSARNGTGESQPTAPVTAVVG